jgi:putative toxin-antitoxin system antitoxin component (TIGR02293 family)
LKFGEIAHIYGETQELAMTNNQGGLSESAAAYVAGHGLIAAPKGLTAALLMTAVISQGLGDRILIDSAVREGIKTQIALELDKRGDVNMDAITRYNIIPRKTWESALKSGADVLTPVNSERLIRVARVTAKARETFGREKADLWMERTTTALAGQAPMALLATESGARAVELLLGRIDHGFAA